MISFLRRSRVNVGLDIGSGYVKAVAIDHSGTAPEVTAVAFMPLVSDAIVEGEIMDPQQVVDTVLAVMQSLGIEARAVTSAVGGRDLIVKQIRMDRMPAEDAREVIRWEAEQYVPFDMENVQLDFQIVDPEGEGLQMTVLLVAAKRELVDQKLMLLSEAGLAVSVLDVDAFALHNAFEYNYPDADRGVVAVVNVGHEISTVLVRQDGAPVLTRDVPFGTRHLREDLRRLHGMSSGEAEGVIQGRSNRVNEVAALLKDRAVELTMGVERAVAFLSMDSGSGRGLSSIYLCGGGAHIPGLSEALTDRLHAPVRIANPLERLSVSARATSQFPEADVASMLMLPIGLALRAPA